MATGDVQNKTFLYWADLQKRGGRVEKLVDSLIRLKRIRGEKSHNIVIYGIPRGGIPVALMVQQELRLRGYTRASVVSNPELATVFVDDIIDSGKTYEKWTSRYDKLFFALVDKINNTDDVKLDWVVFPWEVQEGEASKVEVGPEENIRRILQFIGENPDREGLLETPSRVVRSYEEIFSGYKKDPKDVFKVFEDGACDEMVICKEIEFYSTCEHHMQPFFGKAHIGYVPNGKVIGLSKLARLLDIFSRRLQVQERLTQQVTDALDMHLQPKGSACIIEAKHMCMCARGAKKQSSSMVTSSMSGVFRTNPMARSEFLQLIRNS